MTSTFDPSLDDIPVRFYAEATIIDSPGGGAAVADPDRYERDPVALRRNQAAAVVVLFDDPGMIGHASPFLELTLACFAFLRGFLPGTQVAGFISGPAGWGGHRGEALLQALFPGAILMTRAAEGQVRVPARHVVAVARHHSRTGEINKMLEPMQGLVRRWTPALRGLIGASLGVERRRDVSRRALWLRDQDASRMTPDAALALSQALRRRGLEVRERQLSGATWPELVAEAAAADLVVGLPSNPMACSLFLPPHGGTLEVFPPGTHHYDTQLLAEFADLAYAGVEATETGFETEAGARIGPARGHGVSPPVDVVPAAALERALDRLIGPIPSIVAKRPDDDDVAKLRAEAVKCIHLGLFQRARGQLDDLLQRRPGDIDIAAQARFVANHLAESSEPEPLALVWQPGMHGLWARDFLAARVRPHAASEEFDPGHTIRHRRMIVFDANLGAKAEAYYREAYLAGCEVNLLHWTHEGFGDVLDEAVYRWCRTVMRVYWSPLLAEQRKITFLPLGYKNGFASAQPVRPASQRALTWCFAGDPNKSTRQEMLRAMRQVPGGHEYATTGFAAADNMPVGVYRDLMGDAIFAPCPAGWVNLDSFRVYEALEAGCIPIVERRPGFDYFSSLLGPHPMPTVSDWEEAASMVRILMAQDRAETLRAACHAWWRGYMASLDRRIAALLASQRETAAQSAERFSPGS